MRMRNIFDTPDFSAIGSGFFKKISLQGLDGGPGQGENALAGVFIITSQLRGRAGWNPIPRV